MYYIEFAYVYSVDLEFGTHRDPNQQIEAEPRISDVVQGDEAVVAEDPSVDQKEA